MSLRRPHLVAGSGVAGEKPVPPLDAVDSLDWQVIVNERPNVLLRGSDAVCDAAVSALWPVLRRPVHRWLAELERPLPRLDDGTLVVDHLAACLPAQQTALLDWLDATDARVQIVSTAEQPLLTLVAHGFFLPELYYRVNTIYLDLSQHG